MQTLFWSHCSSSFSQNELGPLGIGSISFVSDEHNASLSWWWTCFGLLDLSMHPSPFLGEIDNLNSLELGLFLLIMDFFWCALIVHGKVLRRLCWSVLIFLADKTLCNFPLFWTLFMELFMIWHAKWLILSNYGISFRLCLIPFFFELCLCLLISPRPPRSKVEHYCLWLGVSKCFPFRFLLNLHC